MQDLSAPVFFERIVSNLAEQISKSFCYLRPVDVDNLLFTPASIQRNNQVNLESDHDFFPLIYFIAQTPLDSSFSNCKQDKVCATFLCKSVKSTPCIA
jgi:hypothetical protein